MAGPAKLVRNTGKPSGRLAYRVRMLELYGWHIGVLSWYQWTKLDSLGREVHLASVISSLTEKSDSLWAAQQESGYGSDGAGGVAALGLADDGAEVGAGAGSRGVVVSRGHVRASPVIQETPPE